MSCKSWSRFLQWVLGTEHREQSARGAHGPFARLQVMRLEDRRVLSGTPWAVLDDAAAQDSTSEPITVDAGADADDGQADEFHVSFREQADGGSGLEVVVDVNGRTVLETLWQPETQLVIAGSSDADRLVVDFSQFDSSQFESLVGRSLVFQADAHPGGNVDTLQLLGGTETVVTHTFDGEGAGFVEVAGMSLAYDDTESVQDGLVAESRLITEVGRAQSLEFSDGAAAGSLRLTAESGFQLEFASPTDHLLVSTVGSDGADGDRLTLGDIDSQFSGSFEIAGDASDSIDFAGPIASHSHAWHITAGTVEMSADVHLQSAEFRIDAHERLVVHEGADLSNLGGRFEFHSPLLDFRGDVDASASGEVLFDAGPDGRLDLYGSISATGSVDELSPAGQGGDVILLGRHILLHDGARVDVSGPAGGGSLLIGGDFQGANPELHNATTVTVSAEVLLSADATLHGDGGKVILWSNGTTRFDGAISARGGASGGDGGFVEVSGKQHLAFDGRVDASAPLGEIGRLLLDPETIVISDADGTNNAETADGQVLFNDPGGLPAGTVFFIQPSAFESVNADVTLQATSDIFVLDAIDLSSAGATTFTLQAGTDIFILADITGSNAARHLVFEADANGSNGTGSVIVDANVTIDSNGGDITFRAAGLTFIPSSAVVAGAGNVTLQPSTAVAIDVGTANTGVFVVTDADLALISSSGVITIGDRNLASTMEVRGVSAGAKNLRLETAGTINDVAANTAVTLTTGRLELIADGIGTTTAFDVDVSRLSLTPGTSFDIASATALSELSVTTQGSVASQSLTDGGTTTYAVTEAGGNTTINTVTGTNLDFGYSNLAGGVTVGTAPGTAIDTAGGDVNLRAADFIAIDAAVVSGGGNVNLLADGDVLFAASGSVDTQGGAGSVVITADADNVGGGAITMADGSFVNAATGTIELRATGDIQVGLASTAGFLQLTSAAGTILDSDAGNGLDLQAGSLLVASATGMGTAADPLESQVGNVEGTSGSGGFHLQNDGNLVVGGVDAGTMGVSATNAPVEITLSGSDDLLEVTEGLDSGGGAITLIADQMQLAASLSSAAGLITLRPNDPGQTIALGAGAADSTTTLGLTDAELDQLIGTGGVTVGSTTHTAGITVVGAADQAAAATITGGVFTLVTAGDIVIDAPFASAIDVTLNSASGDIRFTGTGSVTAAGQTVTLSAAAGEIAGNAAVQTDVTAQSLQLTANQGIGAAETLETAVSDLSAVNQGAGAAGAIDIVNHGSLTVSQTGVTQNTAAGGAILIEVDGIGSDLTVGGIVGGVGADGNVTLSSADQILFAQPAAGIVTTGNALLSAGSDVVGSAANDLDITASQLQLSAAAGVASAAVALQISATAVDVQTTTGPVHIENAATDTVTVTNLLTGAGEISYQQTGDELLRLLSVQTGNGDVTISNSGGAAASILVGLVTADLVDDTVRLSAAGMIDDMTLGNDGVTDITAHAVVFASDAGLGSVQPLELSVNQLSATNTTSGDIVLTNDRTLTVAGPVGVSNAAPGNVISLTVLGAGNDLVIAGTISGAGDVTLSAADQIVFTQAAGVDGVVANGTADLTAGSQIVGNAAAAIDVTAASVALSAATGLGASGTPLEISTGDLTATSTTGDVAIDNAATADVTVTNLTTSSGNVIYRQTGNHNLLLDLASTSDGDVTVSNTGGANASIQIGSISADTIDDAVTITADGAIDDAQLDLLIDITARSAELNAGTGIGNTAPLETHVAELSGTNTTTGDIRVSNIGTLAVGGTNGLRNQAPGGKLEVSVSGPGADVVVTGAVSADGDIVLTSPDEIRFAQPLATVGVASFNGTTHLNAATRIVGNGLNATDVGGLALVANSTTGIGTATVPLQTAVSQLEALGGSGGVFVVNTGSLTLTGSGVTADGSVRVGTTGALTIPVPVTSNLADVVLSSTGLLTTQGTGVITAAGDVTLTAGDIALQRAVRPGSSRAFLRGTGTVLLGTQTGSGLQLNNAEAALIEADMLIIGRPNSGTIIAEGFRPANADTLVLRSGQSILSGSQAGAPDVTVDNLAIDTALGVELETNVLQVAALNRVSGDIRISDLAGDLTVGSVLTEMGTLVGITNAGAGDVDLSTAGTLLLMQNITTFGGRIDGDTGNGVRFAPGVSARIIEGGVITGAVDGIPANLQNLTAPQITQLGEGNVLGQFGDNIGLLARNYTITVDWMDGVVDTFTFGMPQTPGGPVSFQFSHFYLQNPTGSSAAPIPILVTVADDARIEFSINGRPIETPGQLLFAEVPGTGIFGVRIDTTPDIAPLVFPPMTSVPLLDDVVPGTLDTTQAVPLRSSSLDKVAVDERIILLRVLSPTGETVRDIPLDESVLDDLPGMFSRLPDGHYRIYLKEPGEFRERLVLDVDVRQGKAVDQMPADYDPNRDAAPMPSTGDAESESRGEAVPAPDATLPEASSGDAESPADSDTSEPPDGDSGLPAASPRFESARDRNAAAPAAGRL